jgi:hypothetical protein
MTTNLKSKLVAVRHGNGRDWWLILLKYGENLEEPFVPTITNDICDTFYAPQPINPAYDSTIFKIYLVQGLKVTPQPLQAFAGTKNLITTDTNQCGFLNNYHTHPKYFHFTENIFCKPNKQVSCV